MGENSPEFLERNLIISRNLERLDAMAVYSLTGNAVGGSRARGDRWSGIGLRYRAKSITTVKRLVMVSPGGAEHTLLTFGPGC